MESKKKCPCGNGMMELCEKDSFIEYNGVSLKITSEQFVCPHCGIEAGTIEQTAKFQRIIAEDYREKTGLLKGSDIKRLRIESGLTEEQLGKLVDCSGKMISDWESCIVQGRDEDRLLRQILIKD